VDDTLSSAYGDDLTTWDGEPASVLKDGQLFYGKQLVEGGLLVTKADRNHLR
jgi:hypothetical protein